MGKRKRFWLIIVIVAAVCTAFSVFVIRNLDRFGKTYTLEDYELKEFAGNASDYDKLSIDVESTQVEVIATDSDQIIIKYYNMDQDYYTVSAAAEEIKVTDTNELETGLWGTLFGYSIPKKTVTIAIPKTASLAMDYKIQYGDAVFSEINTDQELKIKTDSVNITLQNVTASNLAMEMKYGEAEMNKVNVHNAIQISGKEARFQMSNIAAGQFVCVNKEGKLNMETLQSKTFQCDTDTVTVTFAQIDSDEINMTAKYGSIAGSFTGSSDDYTVTSKIKDGKNNLSEFQGTGSRTIHIEADSASAAISFTE